MKITTPDNKNQHLKKLSNYINYIVVLKYIPLSLLLYLPFSHPHIHRQSDTMGVTIRYFYKFFTQSESLGWKSILPSILQSGHLQGIMPMEFPLINILLSPAFVFFESHFMGMYLSRLLLFLLTLFLWSKIYKKLGQKQLFGIDLSLSLKVLLIATIAAQYIDKFMPDVFSFLLCLYGFSFLYQEELNVKKIMQSNLFISLGLLIKPTAIIVFVPLLFPFSFKNLLQQAKAFVLPLTVTLLYYLKASAYLMSLADFEPLFKTKLRSPARNLVTFFQDFPAFLELVSQQLLFPFALIFFVLFFFFYRKNLPQNSVKNFFMLLLCLFIQVAFIILIDGSHSLRHHYYFIGTSLITASLIAFLMQYSSLRFSLFLLVVLGVRATEMNFYSIKPIYGKNTWKECATLMEKYPNIFNFKQQKIFSNFEEKYPELGLCFGVRTNALKSEFFLSKKVETLPSECENVDQTEHLVISKCPNLELEYGN